MLKFLRKYNKWLLVVGGSLLLIAWLVPSAIREFGQNPERRVVMTVNGRSVRAKEYQHWQTEYESLRKLFLGFGVPGSAEQYLLLTELAQLGGYVGGAAEGRASIPELAQHRARIIQLEQLRQQYPTLPSNFLLQFANQPQFVAQVDAAAKDQIKLMELGLNRVAATGLTDTELELALARMRGIKRLEETFQRTARISAPRALLQAKKDLDKTTVDYVFVSADRNVPEVVEPDDKTLQEHLDRFKDTKPGEGEFGIGYLLPARAKLQYLTLDRNKIAAKIQPDIKELKRIFRDEYTPTKPGQTFEEAKPSLERQFKNKMVEKILGFADQIIKTEIEAGTRQLPEDPATGLRRLPENWATTRPDFNRISLRVVEWVAQKTKPDASRAGITIDPPEVKSEDTQYLTAKDLAALPGVGTSTRLRGSARESFADYVLSVRELNPKSTLTLQTGLPFEEPTRDGQGNVYYTFVLDTRPESVPSSVAEARPLLVKDWKRLQAYKSLSERDVEALKLKAIAEGVAALDEKKTPEPGKPVPASGFKSNVNVTRASLSPTSPDADLPVFRDAVFAAASKLDPTKDVGATDAVERTFVVLLPQRLGLAIGVVKSLAPLTYESFRQQEYNIARRIQNDEITETKSNPFSVDRLKKRLNVKFPNEKAGDTEGT